MLCKQRSLLRSLVRLYFVSPLCLKLIKITSRKKLRSNKLDYIKLTQITRDTANKRPKIFIFLNNAIHAYFQGQMIIRWKHAVLLYEYVGVNDVTFWTFLSYTVFPYQKFISGYVLFRSDRLVCQRLLSISWHW